MTCMPAISVLMGIHRIDPYVWPAIDSILGQRGVTMEVIIVANGPDCAEVMTALAQRYTDDMRVRVYQTPVAQLAHALNVALSVARHSVVARMDADDVAHPQRLQRQWRFLQSTDNAVVGCAVRLIDAHGQQLGRRVPATGGRALRRLPWTCGFVHPTVVGYRSTLLAAGGYSGGFCSEDYDLWLRLRRMGVSCDNMPDILLDYRLHGGTAQRRLLAYAETAGYMMREFVLSKNPLWLAAAALAFVKGMLRRRR